jgi:predicted nucleic acid-binding protein
VTFLDAYALIAFTAGDPAGGEVESILREGEARVVVVNFAEAIDVCRRVHRLHELELRDVLEPLLAVGALTTVLSTEADAWSAAGIRAEHYHRRDRPLSTADCFLLAHATADSASIATCDPDVAAAARALGVDLVALPDTSGTRP